MQSFARQFRGCPAGQWWSMGRNRCRYRVPGGKDHRASGGGGAWVEGRGVNVLKVARLQAGRWARHDGRPPYRSS